MFYKPLSGKMHGICSKKVREINQKRLWKRRPVGTGECEGTLTLLFSGVRL
ncbi:hypothetical protein [Gimesia chilikensis]|nr:hypothetical protein [Gimesia chilikensis]